MVAMISFAISGFSPFGTKDIFTASGNEKIITNYFRLHDYIYGVYSSENIKDLWAFYMTDPINLITLLFPRNLIISVFSILYTLKLGLASLSFSIFLSKRKNNIESSLSDSSKSAIIILCSFAYSLSGYMLIYGANISFVSVVAIFPIIMLAFEELIRSGKWKYYYFALLVSVIFNTYATLVVILFSFLYLFTIKYKNNKHILKTLCYKLLAEILAIGSTSIVVIPALSSSTAKEFFFEDPPYNYNILNFFDIFKRFLTLAEPSATTGTAYGIDISLGMLAIVTLFIYLANPKYDIFMKIKKMIPICILVIATSMTGINSILNLYAKNSFNSCFFGFELVFLLILLSFETLCDIKNINSKIIIASSCLTGILVVLSMIFANKYVSTTPFTTSIEVIIIYAVILYVISSNKTHSHNALIILSIISAIELVITFSFGSMKLASTKSEYNSTYSANTYAIESYIKSQNKDANIVVYDYIDYYFNPVLNYISKTNYVFCPTGSDKPDACLEYVDTIGNVDVYIQENSYDGYIYADSSILDWTYSLSTPYMSTNYLYSILTGKEQSIFKKTNVKATLLSDTNFDYKESENQQVSYFDMEYTFEDRTDIYSNYISSIYIGNSENNNNIYKKYSMTIYDAIQYNVKTNNFYSFDKSCFYGNLKNISYINENESVKNDGYIIISVGNKPYYNISIDGKETDYISVDDCLWLVPITSGSHIITQKPNTDTHSLLFILLSVLSIAISLIIFKNYSIILLLKKVLKKPYRVFKDNYVYLSTIIITISVYLLACLLCSGVPFGKLSILASDGYVQTYPRIQNMIDHLSIKSLIPGSIGFNIFIFSCGSDPISSVIATIINLFYRLFIWTNDGRLYGAILGAYYMVLSGPAIIFYLTHRYSGKRIHKKNPYLILIALFYTLSAYVIGYYHFNNFLYSIYTPIILYALEKMIYKKKPLLYILTLSFIMIRGYYSAFLLCEFIGLFFLTLDFDSIKDFTKKGLSFLITSLLAAGLGAFNLLPAFMSTLNSAYKESDTVSTNAITIGSSIFKTINQYQIGQKSVVMSTDNGLVNIYSGLIPLIFLGIYVLNNNIKLSIRIRKTIICVILFWAFGDSILNFVFHGFHFQSNVPNRFAMFFTFLIITLFTDVILDLKSISKKRMIVPICSIGLILICSWSIYPEKKFNSYVLSIIFTLAYIIITIFFYCKEYNKTKYFKLIAYISTIEILISSTMFTFSSFGHRNANLEDNLKSIKIISKDIKNDNDIFLSEYLDSNLDNLNSGLITGLNTITGFSSELNSQAIDLVDGWGINVADNNIEYLTGNPIADMMLHLKYQYIDTDNDEYGKATIYNKIATHNNIELYENPYFLPVGFMTDSKLANWNISNNDINVNYLDNLNSFSQMVCGKDVFSRIDPQENTDDESYFNSQLSEESTYGTYDVNIDIRLDKKYSGDFYVFYGNNIDYIGSTDRTENNEFHFIIHDYQPPSENAQLQLDLAILNREVLQEMHETFNESTLVNIEKTKKYFTGDINVKEDGILYLSIPCYGNMKIYVDGNKVDHFKYLYGTGIKLNKGNHDIKIEGYTKNYYVGVIITVISLLLLIILYIFNKLFFRKIFKDKVPEEDSKKQNKNKKSHRTISYFFKKINKTYLLSFVIPLIIVTISMINSGFAPFGPRDVITANDESALLRYFYELYDRVHSGQSIFAYSMHEGTGYDFTTVLSYYLSDPTNLLVILFPRTSLLTVLNILYIIKVSLSGLFMCIYLDKTNIKIFKENNQKKKGKTSQNTSDKKEQNKKDLLIGGSEEAPSIIKSVFSTVNIPALVFSLIYPLSNYMLGPGFNITTLSAVMIFPLLMLGFEKLILEQKKKLYIVAYALSFMFSFRIAIISSIFMIFYLIIADYKNINHFIITLKNKVICDAITLFISAVFILNNVFSIFWTNDITILEKPSFSVGVFDVIKMMTTGIKPANILLAGNNIYMYCGIVTLLFTLFFVFNNKIKLSIRIKYTCLYILLFCGFIITSLNTILNGFLYFDGLLSLFAYTFIFISIVISYKELKLIKGQSTTRLVIPAFISAALVIGALFLCESYDTPSTFMKSLEFLFFYSIVLIIYSNQSLTKWLMRICICILIPIELLISYYPSMKMLSWYTYPYNKLNTYKEATTLDELEKEEPEEKNLIINPKSSKHTPLEISLLGYDHIIWLGDNAYSSLDYAKTINDIDIYNTNVYDSYLLDSSIVDYQYNKYSPIESINVLSNDYLKTPITMYPIAYSEEGGNYANQTNYIYIMPSDGGDLFFNYSYISNINNVTENETAEFTQYVDKNRQKYVKGLFSFSKQDFDTTMKLLEGYDIKVNNLSDCKFDIKASKNGYITLGLKNRPGWNITVNGKNVKPKEFLKDGMIIPVEKGNNRIKIKYVPIMFYIGLIITILTILFIIFRTKILSLKILEKQNIIKTTKRFIKGNYTYITIIIIITFLFILCQIIAGRYPFGTLPAFTSDGLEQKYAGFVNNINAIKNKNIFYSFDFSIGGFKETYDYGIYNIIFPWLTLKYLLIPDCLILLDYTFILYLNVILSSVSILFYLTHRSNKKYNKQDIRLIPIGLLYSLSSYGMVMFSYESYRYTCYLPLIVLGLDSLLEKNKKIPYIFMLSLMMIYEPYHAFILCEFIVLYFLTLSFDNIKDFFKKLLKFAICSITSACLVAFYLIPYYVFTTQSIYKEGDKTLPRITSFFSNFLIVLSDYRSFNVFGAVSNNNSQAAIYSGMIMLFVIPLFLFIKGIPKNQRIRKIALLALIYLAFNNELINYILHGFHVQSMVPNRFAIFFVFIMIEMLSIVILSFKDYSQSQLQGTFIITSIIFIFLYLINKDIPGISVIVSTIILILFMGLIIVYTIKKISKEKLLKIMICIAIIDIIANYIYIFPKQIEGSSNIINEATTINRISNQVPDTKEFYNLTEYIGNHPLYHNIGQMTDINTLSFFASDYTKDMYDRVEYYNLSTGKNSLEYNNGNPLADMMLGVKYHIEDINDDSAYSIYNNILNYGHYNLYENPNYVSFGFLVQNDTAIKEIKQSKNNNYNAFDYQNSVTNALNGSDIYTTINCKLYTNKTNYDSSKTYYVYGDVYTDQNAKTKREAYVPVNFLLGNNIEGYIYVCIDNNIYFLGIADEETRQLSIDYPLETVNSPGFTPYIAVLNKENLSVLHSDLSQNSLKNIEKYNSTITAKINCTNSGTLYISLPYYESWKIYIDGKEVTKERFMGGIGVPITSGNHAIEMKYYPRGVALGTLISIITILLLLGYGFYLKKGHSYIKITKDINKGGSKE